VVSKENCILFVHYRFTQLTNSFSGDCFGYQRSEVSVLKNKKTLKQKHEVSLNCVLLNKLCAERLAITSGWTKERQRVSLLLFLLRDWLASLCCWAASGECPLQWVKADIRGRRSDTPELFSAGWKTSSTSGWNCIHLSFNT